MISTYTCQRKTNRWPCAVFDNILNVSALNSFIIYSAIFPNWCQRIPKRRKKFLVGLGNALVEPLIMQRSGSSVPRSGSAKKILREVQASVLVPSVNNVKTNVNQPTKKRIRCAFCVKKETATRYVTFCNNCKKTVCPSHTAPITCNSCIS